MVGLFKMPREEAVQCCHPSEVRVLTLLPEAPIWRVGSFGWIQSNRTYLGMRALKCRPFQPATCRSGHPDTTAKETLALTVARMLGDPLREHDTPSLSLT